MQFVWVYDTAAGHPATAKTSNNLCKTLLRHGKACFYNMPFPEPLLSQNLIHWCLFRPQFNLFHRPKLSLRRSNPFRARISARGVEERKFLWNACPSKSFNQLSPKSNTICFHLKRDARHNFFEHKDLVRMLTQVLDRKNCPAETCVNHMLVATIWTISNQCRLEK